MKINLNLNELRNKALDTVIKVADKAKAKPVTVCKLTAMIDEADLSNTDKLEVLRYLQAQVAALNDNA